ncbi:winged helix-turn-helix transcriptional regulator [Sphingobacterium humi]|uniref:Transcriptional regulator n=1 Tax=Sphingobacterium humi TaxID=1796905 RepID=A0A6N8L1V5_9SPHI|nr:helix-turn-helix domain-containing protein [Sphingobacterium humi]MVZ63715.1 transcriptional regulator [Sphingobacterium humi]
MKTLENYSTDCGINLLAMRDTLDVLGGKWKLLILHYLITREHEINTFKKMEREITGISAKMLTKELRDLETNKLVHRAQQDTRPITVRYSITPYGKNAEILIQQLVTWGKNHRAQLTGKVVL